MTPGSMTNKNCPHCGNDHLYQLGDGRSKCSACRRKFSLVTRRSRLTAEAMERIVAGFSEMSPASLVASETGLNLKTVQLYYGRIRELLAKDREAELANRYGSAKVSADAFANSAPGDQWRNAIFIGCLVAHETEIALFFTNDNDNSTIQLESSAIAGWLVAANRRVLEDYQLDKIFCLPGRNAKERARVFWLHAKRRLSTYCGGFKKNFHLYLREMEFRNNIKNTKAAQEHIETLLERTAINSTGEEDA